MKAKSESSLFPGVSESVSALKDLGKIKRLLGIFQRLRRMTIFLVVQVQRIDRKPPLNVNSLKQTNHSYTGINGLESYKMIASLPLRGLEISVLSYHGVAATSLEEIFSSECQQFW